MLHRRTLPTTSAKHVEARRRLRLASSPSLVVRRTRLCGCRRTATELSGCRLSSLEQSATPRHVCTVTTCFSQLSEDPSLRTQFSLTILLCPRSDIRHYGHVYHCFYLRYLMVVHCVAAERRKLIERKIERKESSYVKLKAFPTNVERPNYTSDNISLKYVSAITND